MYDGSFPSDFNPVISLIKEIIIINIGRKGTGIMLTRIGGFIAGIITELSKTVTPTVKEWLGWSIAVLVFVLLLMLAMTGLDGVLGELTLRIFGN